MEQELAMEEPSAKTPMLTIGESDWLLVNLVNLANATAVRIGLTLNVGGSLISGNLVGGKEYFELFSEDFASGFTDPAIAKDVGELYASFGSIYKESPDSDTDLQPTYIHLSEARFFGSDGTNIPAAKGALWRGRLDKVDGFVLGRFQED